MRLSEILDSIGHRKMFTPIANAIRHANLSSVSTGWTGTRGKLESLAANPDHGALVTDKLRDIYLENLRYSQKAVTIWMIKTDVANKVASALANLVDQASPYLASFPKPLTEATLQKTTALCVPTAVAVDDGEHTLYIISKRSKTEEEVMSTDVLKDAAKAAGYTEVIARRRLSYQVFDSITVVPSTGRVELRIDQAKGLSDKEILGFRETIRKRFNEWIAHEIDVEEDVLGTPVNLFPALGPLYKGKGWTVTRIDHVNEGGYNNTNRGRNRQSDVRQDMYHSTGETAVKHLQLWNVTATFRSPGGAGSPVLILEGHTSMLSVPSPHMDLALFLDCAGAADYRLLMGTLLSCLAEAETAANDPKIDRLDAAASGAAKASA